MNETQIHLRVSDELRQELEIYAGAYGTSVAAAARILIRKGLAAEKEGQS
jgi:plasmid stability protein